MLSLSQLNCIFINIVCPSLKRKLNFPPTFPAFFNFLLILSYFFLEKYFLVNLLFVLLT